MKKNIKNAVIFMTAAVLTLSMAGGGRFQAAEAILPRLENVVRDETVYVRLNNDGSVNQAEVVVHIFSEGAGAYSDSSRLDNIVNLTNSLAPDTSSGLTWNFTEPAGNFYYQGDLTRYELPFNFDFGYKLDGVDIDDPSGVSGHLEISLNVASNEKSAKAFTDNFMCQLQYPLNIEKCSNIVAEGAASALVGGVRTLSYTTLPGGSGSFTISADVNNFSASGMTISLVAYDISSAAGLGDAASGISDMLEGVGLMLDSTEELADGLTQAADGIASISEASGVLRDGYVQLYEGLKDGVNAASQLTSGSSQLVSGVKQVENGLARLEQSGALIKSGLDNSTDAADITQAMIGLSQIITSSATMSEAEKQAALQYIQGISASLSQSSQELAQLTQGISAYIDGVDALAAQVPALSDGIESYVGGVNSAISGFGEALASFDELNGGMGQMTEGLDVLNQNLPALSEGAQAFSDAQLTLMDGITLLDDALSSTLTPADKAQEIPSFTNAGKVDSLQFVLKTPEIAGTSDKALDKPYVEPEKTFIDKIKGLFGIN